MNRPGMSGVSGLTGAVQPVHLERLTPRSLVLEGDRLPSSRRQLGPLSPLAYGYLATLKVMVWLLVTGVPGCGGEKITTSRKTHWPEGHEYTPENTYIIPFRGYRTCRTCGAVKHNEARKRKRRKASHIPGV